MSPPISRRVSGDAIRRKCRLLCHVCAPDIQDSQLPLGRTSKPMDVRVVSICTTGLPEHGLAVRPTPFCCIVAVANLAGHSFHAHCGVAWPYRLWFGLRAAAVVAAGAGAHGALARADRRRAHHAAHLVGGSRTEVAAHTARRHNRDRAVGGVFIARWPPSKSRGAGSSSTSGGADCASGTASDGAGREIASPGTGQQHQQQHQHLPRRGPGHPMRRAAALRRLQLRPPLAAPAGPSRRWTPR